MVEKIKVKKLVKNIICAARVFRLRVRAAKFATGPDFYCATGCRVSRGRSVHMGANVYVGHDCHFGTDLVVDDEVLIASSVSFVGGDHVIDDATKPIRLAGREIAAKIVIERGAWIGHGAILLNGISIGSGAVIGAGSVVTKSVPSKEVYCGNPARFVKHRFIE